MTQNDPMTSHNSIELVHFIFNAPFASIFVQCLYYIPELDDIIKINFQPKIPIPNSLRCGVEQASSQRTLCLQPQ